uniref:Uncharacterized protein n=1 Tax=Zea mays TaxID=4577 RepID=B6SGK4_MAIZE|nr:hypothetical protein [Zea mays]ACG24161.1 hypothetical protein [Zea mays]ACG25724.1 hypothetical protein [Zea mays]
MSQPSLPVQCPENGIQKPLDHTCSRGRGRRCPLWALLMDEG